MLTYGLVRTTLPDGCLAECAPICLSGVALRLGATRGLAAEVFGPGWLGLQ